MSKSGGGARRQPCEKDRREEMQQSDKGTIGTSEDGSSLRLAGEPRAKRVGNQFDGFKRQHARCD